MVLLRHLPAWLENYDIQRCMIIREQIKIFVTILKIKCNYKNFKMEKGTNQN